MMMNPVVLFRRGFDDDNEIEIVRQYFDVYENRCEIPENSLVIGRYSVLPYYKELEKDIILRRSHLINSHNGHSFIANDIMTWANDTLEGLTPPAYSQWGNLAEGSYVVKGKTNSRKHHWDTHMFAKTKSDIARVARNLLDDSMINEQGLIVRPYIPLKQLDIGINGLPVTHEWRFFFLKQAILSYGFYWSFAENPPTNPSAKVFEVARKAAEKVAEHVDFYVLDIAETEDDEAIVIEINDAQMAGLSLNDPHSLYKNLRNRVEYLLTDAEGLI